MRNIMVLNAALSIVEARLTEPMSADDLARACYLSCSGLQKLFNYAFHCSASEYVTKRRLSCAARELLESDKPVIEIALNYQYGSPEAFSRAFKRFFNISPSAFRQTRRFPELHPKFNLKDNGGMNIMRRKPIDISELYDELKKSGGTYVLSLDIMGLDPINKHHGHAAGDAVIAEAFARLERAIPDDMLMFRIGGDEFAVVTGLTSASDAEALARKIVAMNGETVSHGDEQIPLSFRIGVSRAPEGTLDYQRALTIMVNATDRALTGEDLVAVIDQIQI